MVAVNIPADVKRAAGWSPAGLAHSGLVLYARTKANSQAEPLAPAIERLVALPFVPGEGDEHAERRRIR